MKKLLLVVDYQNDFVNGALGFDGAEKLEPGIFAAVENTLASGGYVLFTRDTHPKNYLETREGKFLPLPHCVEGTEGHQLFGRLHSFETSPRERTKIINKETFGSKDITDAVTALCGGEPDAIDVCGLVTDICVITNTLILHSHFLNTEIRVLGALIGSGDTEKAQKALDVLRGMGIEITA